MRVFSSNTFFSKITLFSGRCEKSSEYMQGHCFQYRCSIQIHYHCYSSKTRLYLNNDRMIHCCCQSLQGCCKCFLGYLFRYDASFKKLKQELNKKLGNPSTKYWQAEINIEQISWLFRTYLRLQLNEMFSIQGASIFKLKILNA